MVMPRCTLSAMNLPSRRIATHRAWEARRAACHQAGWHLSDRLIVPPQHHSDLGPGQGRSEPAGNLWQFPARQLAHQSDLNSFDTSSITARCMEQTYKPALADHVDRPSDWAYRS